MARPDGTGTGEALALALVCLLGLEGCPSPTSHTLSITVAPNGSGSVAKDPDQTDYTTGTTVTLTAFPHGGWAFQHWEGDLLGSANPALVSMDSDRQVTAAFVAAPPVPASFSQKVLIEEATGTWCGYCPDGAYRMQQLIDQSPGRVFGVAYHTGDSLAIAEYGQWSSGLGGVPGVPMGAVNRTEYAGSLIIGTGQWSSAATSALGQTAPCGLRIVSRLAGGTATIDVSVGFCATVTSEVHLTVLMAEDELTGYPQANYYDTVSTSPFYQRGNPIVDYVHPHVLRCFVTPVFGDTIAAADATAGAFSAFSYTCMVRAGWTAAKLTVLAVVHGYGEQPADMRVLNVQSVALGNTQEWD